MCLLCIQDKEKTKVTLDDLQHMPYVKWCIMEAIRLRAPGAITRKVVRPLKLQVSHDTYFSVFMHRSRSGVCIYERCMINYIISILRSALLTPTGYKANITKLFYQLKKNCMLVFYSLELCYPTWRHADVVSLLGSPKPQVFPRPGRFQTCE